MSGSSKSQQTLVVNCFGGPSAGKSTIATGVFSDLKFRGINCEYVNEFAKQLVWEERHQTFKDQIYIFGKQYHRIHRLLGQVEIIITDSPILLTIVYDGEKRKSLEQLVIEEHNKMWTYNVFLNRKKDFNPKGRLHDENEAKTLDLIIAEMLNEHNVIYEVFNGNPEGRDAIVKKVIMLLNWNEHEKE